MPIEGDGILRADNADGWAKIPNMLIEALACAPISASEFRVIWFIIRRTYGWLNGGDRKHKADVFTRDEMCRATGLAKGTAATAIASLQAANIVLSCPVNPCNVRGYGINTTVEEWGLQTPAWSIFRATLLDARDFKLFNYNQAEEPRLEYESTSTRKRVDLDSNMSRPRLKNESTSTRKRVDQQPANVGTEPLPGSVKTLDIQDTYKMKENDSLAAPAAAASSDADKHVAIPDEAFADETTTPAQQPSPLVLFETRAAVTEADPEPDNRTYLSETDPLKRAIWRCWSALGLEGPPASDMAADGKTPMKQYAGWHKLAQEHGDRKVDAWASVIERTRPTLPESKQPGAWFGTIFRNAMRAHWEWGWDETTQKLKEPRQAPGPVAMPQEYVDKVTEDLKDWWDGK